MTRSSFELFVLQIAMEDDYVRIMNVRDGSPETTLESPIRGESTTDTTPSTPLKPTQSVVSVSAVSGNISNKSQYDGLEGEASRKRSNDSVVGFEVEGFGVVVVVALGVLATFSYLRSAAK